MNIFQAFVLGAIQGLGEFLPVSSSAHLILAPWFFGWQDHGIAFDVALHWGTLAAIFAYFRRDVFLLIGGFWDSLFRSTRDLRNNLNQRMAWLLIVASVPGALAGKLLEEQAEHAFRNPLLLAGTLGGFGLILLAADYYGRKQGRMEGISWWQTIVIGFAQALAIVPGISRSGSTIAAGLAVGLQRTDAARFSFLLSMPIVLGAGVLKARDFGADAEPFALAAGFLASAVFGFLAIKCLLQYVAKRNFGIFVGYRIALAVIILIRLALL